LLTLVKSQFYRGKRELLYNGVMAILTPVNDEFRTWLDAQINTRGWSYAELSRRMGISGSLITLVLKGDRGVSADFCVALAIALRDDAVKILRLAGIDAPIVPRDADELDALTSEALRILHQLTRSEREVVVRMLRGLLES